MQETKKVFSDTECALVTQRRNMPDVQDIYQGLLIAESLVETS